MYPAIPETFDRSSLTPMAFLPVLKAEQRGVFYALRDALRQAKDVVFRIGSRPMGLGEISSLACEDLTVLERVMPELVITGFIQRDTDGAFYSPHLVESAIRREERAAAKAERLARLEELSERQRRGEIAPDATLRALTSPGNGARGGRPKKGETPEEAYARRTRAAAEIQRKQRSMPLVSVLQGGNGDEETQNLNQFQKQVLVSGELGFETGFGVPVDLESRDISLSNSRSAQTSETQTGNPGPEITEGLISQTVARVLKLGRLPEGQEGFARSICGRFLREGIPPSTLVEAVKQHAEKMALNGDTARTMGAFCKPIERFWADYQAGVSTAPEPEPAILSDWEQAALESYALARKLRRDMMVDTRDFSAMERQWPEIAKAKGLPLCAVSRDAYLAWFRLRAHAA